MTVNRILKDLRFDENILLFSNTFVFSGSKKKPCFFANDVAQCPGTELNKRSLLKPKTTTA